MSRHVGADLGELSAIQLGLFADQQTFQHRFKSRCHAGCGPAVLRV
jgi:hypothetical protein